MSWLLNVVQRMDAPILSLLKDIEATLLSNNSKDKQA